MLTVSVIIPCYNCSKTISRALESVLAQTATPLEVIIVDDASIDGSDRVIDSFTERLGPIDLKLLKNPTNRGAAWARNQGWDLASGDLVAFLDSDDSWHPRKIELQSAWMNEDSTVQACGHEYEIKKSGELESWPPLQRLSLHGIKKFRFQDFLLKNRLSTPTVMVRRSIPERFNQNKRYCEDYDLWLRISHNHGFCSRSQAKLARLHKQPWGSSGLSANLWSMHNSEIECYKDCFEKNWITKPKLMCLMILSLIKHWRRLIQQSLGIVN